MHFVKKVMQAVLGLIASLAVETTFAEVVPIVSADNPVKSLSQHELANMFLGKIHQFPNGNRVTPVDQPANAPPRHAFYSKYADMSPVQLKAHWAKIIFTGRGRPPDVLSDNATVKQWVANNPHGIGYIERAAVDHTVQIVQVQ